LIIEIIVPKVNLHRVAEEQVFGG